MGAFNDALAGPVPMDMPTPPTNSPWAFGNNQKQLQNNSSYLPDNYMIEGNQNPHQAYDQGGTPQNPLPNQNNTGYPAMANSMGLGTTPSPAAGSMGGGTPTGPSIGATPGNLSDPSFATKALSQAVSDSGSRGFNPWSMQGESNARNA